ARLLGGPRAAGSGEPVDERDLARSVRARVVGGTAVADVDELTLERLHRGGEGMREPLDRAAVGEVKSSLERQADVSLDPAPLHLDAIGLQHPLDVVERLRLARAARLALHGAHRPSVLPYPPLR